ncbi:hypothetical protein AGOR_G00244200 [Albula goreensis]|uniref:Uncharacterized protein n=1 Tax=Albula goreensis TaxID=1534307 RepID=A0A8T3CIT9_9TELE|nr:hypothetical protein AGOR_G00244200 [Albula goreensis]
MNERKTSSKVRLRSHHSMPEAERSERSALLSAQRKRVQFVQVYGKSSDPLIRIHILRTHIREPSVVIEAH